MYFEEWLSETLLLTGLQQWPKRTTQRKQQGPPKTLLLSLKNYSCPTVRITGWGDNHSMDTLGGAIRLVMGIPVEPIVPVGLLATSQQSQLIPAWSLMEDELWGDAPQLPPAVPLSIHPHTLQEFKGVSSPASLLLCATSGGSATPAVIQAVYSCLRCHDVDSLDLSKLGDILNFGLFAAKWDDDCSNF